MVAAYYNHIQSIKKLLKVDSIDIDAQDVNGNTALSLAIMESNSTAIEMLLPMTSIF